ncbi:MAG: CehA/McbA family metallohydrolase [Candidatus Limnocylindrales bacterium]
MPARRQVFRGLPFRLPGKGAARRWLLLDRPIEVDLRTSGPVSHLVIAHFCDAWHPMDGGRPADLPIGWVTPVGQDIALYAVESVGGRRTERTIRRRFEINEGIVGWGQGAFAARAHQLDEPLDWQGPLPGHEPARYAPPGQAGLLAILPGAWGPAQTGVADSVPSPTDEIVLWLHEIAIPGGPAVLAQLSMEPLASMDDGGGVIVAAITAFRGKASPLHLEPRRSLRVERPARARSLPGPLDDGRRSVSLDLGQVIRTRPAPTPLGADWPIDSVPGWGSARRPPSGTSTLVDVAMAADASLVVDGEAIPARRLPADGHKRRFGRISIEPMPLATRRVSVDVVDATTGSPMPARVHFRAADGRYLPPLGHRDEVNPGLNEDTGADLVLGGTTYAYVPGRFGVELPVGTVHVEVARGFGYRPERRSIEVADINGPLVLAMEPVSWPTGDTWVAADCHVHFISPSSALLQAQAEGVGIVNLLATQWGDHHTGVVDLPIVTLRDPTARHLVVMGSENRQNMLGHIGLLGASEAVLPMASGGAPEGRLGDPLRWLMADWSDAARAQHGLAVAVHFPLPYAEVAADIVAGKIEAIEMQALTPGVDGPSIREWYRFLNCGFRLPIVGGTDKMTAEIPLGAIRTYVRLDDEGPLSFERWADAIRSGRTFVTSGPFVDIAVDGQRPGDTVSLGPGGGTVEVRATATAALPVIDGLQLIHDGSVIASANAPAGSDHIDLAERVRVTDGGWLAARVTSSQLIESAFATAMGAHSSPIYLEVPGRPTFDADDAVVIATIIDGARTWVESIAPIAPDVDRRRLLAYFEAARARLDA